jgi:uncharacterized protein
MSLEAHVATLSARHANIDRKIDDELKHVWWDETRVRQLKLQKLKLKEELERLARP